MKRTTAISHIGEKYGHLTIIGIKNIVDKSKDRHNVFLCKCDCGGKREVRTHALLYGGVISCGCRVGGRFSVGVSLSKELYNRYKNNAKKKKLIFELSLDTFTYLIQKRCSYCNKKPETVIKKRNLIGELKYNGLDRVNNNIGYTLDNVVPCCSLCNYIKRTLSYNDFINHIKRIIYFL